MSDSRTSAGVDNISSHSKMHRFGVPGERQFIICSAGNLATTQGVISQVERDIRRNTDVHLLNVANVGDAATYLGGLSRAEQKKTEGNGFEASFLIGGEVLDAACRLMLVYPQGNHIVSSDQTPFLQIGELKYGKPILDRVLALNTTLERAALCALVSMDATMRSNLSVGTPIELNLYRRGSLTPGAHVVYTEDSPYLRQLRNSWDEEIMNALTRLPAVNWSGQTQ
ncbi:MAG: peptidase [Proteobacteria bacterium]|nr:peptidase [Pseudomonadota bacterium]